MADKRGKKINKLENELMARKKEALSWKEQRVKMKSKIDSLAAESAKRMLYLQEIHRATTGKEVEEKDMNDASAIMTSITLGLTHVQTELIRLTKASETTLFSSEMEDLECSCLRCMGPEDPIKEKPKSPEEIAEREQRLEALCRVQKIAKGVVPRCPMFRSQETLKEEATDDDPQREGFHAPGVQGGNIPRIGSHVRAAPSAGGPTGAGAPDSSPGGGAGADAHADGGEGGGDDQEPGVEGEKEDPRPGDGPGGEAQGD